MSASAFTLSPDSAACTIEMTTLYNERRTRLCCLVILQKYNSNLAPSRHLLYCYLGTKRERNAYPFQKNCTNCTASLANILLCNSMDGLQPPDEF